MLAIEISMNESRLEPVPILFERRAASAFAIKSLERQLWLAAIGSDRRGVALIGLLIVGQNLNDR